MVLHLCLRGREVRRERDSFSLHFDKKFENWIIIDLIDLASFTIKEENAENEAVTGLQYGPGTVLYSSHVSPHVALMTALEAGIAVLTTWMCKLRYRG